MASGLGTTSRPKITGLRSQSPAEHTIITADLSSRALTPEARKHSPEKKRRSSALYAGADVRHGINDGVTNLNRWSQSTASSNTSASHKRRNSFSKRLSGSLGPFGSFGNSQASSTNARPRSRPRSPSKLHHSAAAEPVSPPTVNAPVLPPIEALSSLSQAVDSAESPSTPATVTPTTADMLSPNAGASREPDYFGNKMNMQSSPSHISRSRRISAGLGRTNAPPSLSFDPPTRSPPARLPESVYSPRASTRIRQERRQSSNSQHRRRADSTRSNTEGDSSASDHRERSARQQKRRPPSQKALLSKALAKANHAVVLDGRQNIEGAILAYGDACNLLRQVMVRSSGDDDRRKLETVRNTYKNRIAELKSADLSYQSSDSKALPDRPMERDSRETEQLSLVTDDDDDNVTGPEMASTMHAKPHSRYASSSSIQRSENRPFVPPRRQSLRPFGSRGESAYSKSSDQSFGRYQTQSYDEESHLSTSSHNLQLPLYTGDVPPPLSPRRPLSPAAAADEEENPEEDASQSDQARKNEAEHTSWLNTIAESSGSEASSVHSRRSSAGLRRRHIRALRESGQTEAEFNAALDAAVEAAYDEGFEPDDEDEEDEQLMRDPDYHIEDPEPLSMAMRNVELAKENVREAEREAAITRAKQRQKQRLQGIGVARDSIDIEYDDDEADEERMLDEMTRDYILDEAEDDLQRKSALPQPRQSGSSGFSGRTWASSNGSNPASAGTSLTTVAEMSILPSMDAQLGDNPLPPPLLPPPASALPPPPIAPTSAPSQQSHVSVPRPPSLAIRNSSPGVRDRRLSGMKTKQQLKIETNARFGSGIGSDAPKTQQPSVPPLIPPQNVPEPPKSAFVANEAALNQIENRAPAGLGTLLGRKDSTPHPGFEFEPVSATSTLTKVTSAESDTSVPSVPGSPARFASKAATGLRNNFSSSSLRNKSLSANNADGPDASPNTSISSASSMPKQRGAPSPAVPVVPTPLETSFLPKGQPSGGIYLFDCDIHSPISPGTPNPASTNPPLPLEACPESTLLRPFWLLRSIYQTIAHPRGGYITNRLFVPRDIWRVKNIKLKNVEEKVSSCDLLTAALLKLGKVDTYNADAILEEIQFLEGVMDQVQVNLTKKLGNDVGVQGAATSFRGMGVVDDSASNSEALTTKSLNGTSKSYLSSWRKLRAKNSLGPSLGSSTGLNTLKDGLREPPSMKSLPMTAIPNPRFPRRDVSQVQCMGANPSYMGALARLCDAAQILDQIARQVEDPGLKYSSPTHVGLELSARHAAEFFAFYICRFVFADIGLMLDKFIKRGSEWVLS